MYTALELYAYNNVLVVKYFCTTTNFSYTYIRTQYDLLNPEMVCDIPHLYQFIPIQAQLRQMMLRFYSKQGLLLSVQALQGSHSNLKKKKKFHDFSMNFHKISMTVYSYVEISRMPIIFHYKHLDNQVSRQRTIDWLKW